MKEGAAIYARRAMSHLRQEIEKLGAAVDCDDKSEAFQCMLTMENILTSLRSSLRHNMESITQDS